MKEVNKEDQVFSENGKYGLMAPDGKVLLPAIFDDFKLLSGRNLSLGQKVVVCLDGKYGIVCADGKADWLVAPEYDSIGFPNSLTSVRKGNKWGILNTDTNEFVIPLELDSIANGDMFPFVNGVAYFEKDGKHGVMLEDGRFTDTVFDAVELDDNGYIIGRQGDVTGYLNEHGQLTEDVNDSWFYESGL